MWGSRAAGEGIVAGEDLYFCRGNVGGLELLASVLLLGKIYCCKWSV